MAWLELFSQHRKYGMKIILVCQADIMIDKQFRTLVEFEANHRRISSLGLFGKLVKLIAFGEVFYVHTKYYGQNVKVDGELIRCSKRYTRCIIRIRRLTPAAVRRKPRRCRHQIPTTNQTTCIYLRRSLRQEDFK